MPNQVSGNHAHIVTGDVYTYRANYLLLGTMVDWTANVRAGGRALVRVGGSIRLSRGQTRDLVPKLVGHMVAQAIDAMRGAVVPA